MKHNKRKQKPCKLCGAMFMPHSIKRGTFCSLKCAWKASETIVEKRCANCGKMFRPRTNTAPNIHCGWECTKKDVIIHGAGYRLLFKPQHKFADNSGRVLEQRFIMDELMDGGLKDYEVVHHIDSDKQNNQPNNLMALKRAAHVTLHRWEERNGKNYAETTY